MIVVDSSTRQFSIPAADMTFGVEADAGSEVKYFQAPRYVGNHLDLAGSFLRINYRNANGDKDSYLIQDVTVEGESIQFSWMLTPKVTAYKGDVKYVLCATGPDLKVAWHTTLGTGKVLEGLEPDNSHVEEETSDVVAQLIALVESQSLVVEDVGAEWVRNVQSEGTTQIIAVQAASLDAQAEIEAKGENTRNSIPEDYTALSAAIALKAPAIVCEAEGTAITLNDSSDMRLQGMRIFGKSTQDGVPSPEAPVEIVSVGQPTVSVCKKNLFNHGFQSMTANGVIITANEDGSVTANGTSTSNSIVGIGNFVFNAGVSYVLTGCPTGGSDKSYRLDIRSGDQVLWLEYGEGVTVTPSENISATICIRLQGDNTVIDNITFYPMIRLASETDRSYEPCIAQTADITTFTSLPGIPVTSGGNYTDSDGQQWICDEVDLERGVYISRITTVYFSYSAYTEMNEMENTKELRYWRDDMKANSPVFSDKFRSVGNTWGHDTPYIIASGGSIGKDVCLRVPADSDVDYLLDNPINVTFIRATPVETPLSETEIAAYRALHTNKPNTTLLNSEGAHMAVEYVADTKLYIDNLMRRN